MDSGRISFLRSSVEPNQKVVFRKENRTLLTSNHKIELGPSVKFYFTEYGSQIYEYYITKDNKFILCQYDFLNDDLIPLKDLHAKYEYLTIDLIKKRKLIISRFNSKIILSKK